jgi:hypothetical protein
MTAPMNDGRPAPGQAGKQLATVPGTEGDRRRRCAQEVYA